MFIIYILNKSIDDPFKLNTALQSCQHHSHTATCGDWFLSMWCNAIEIETEKPTYSGVF